MKFKENFKKEIRLIVKEARKKFPKIPENEWGIKLILFADGDYQLQLVHSIKNKKSNKTTKVKVSEVDRNVFMIEKGDLMYATVTQTEHLSETFIDGPTMVRDGAI